MAIVTQDGKPLGLAQQKSMFEISFDYVADYADRKGFGLNPAYMFIGSYLSLLEHLGELWENDSRIKAIEIVEVV